MLESPPKWQLLVDVVKEIKEDYSQKYNHSSSYVEANVKEDISEKRKHLSKVHNNRILLILRDDLALSQLRDVLTRGEKSVMEKRYRWFITQQAGSIRNRSKKATKFSDQRGSSSGTNPTDSSDSMSQGIAQRLSEGIAELHSNKDTDSSMDNNSYKSSHGYKGNSYNQSNTDSEEWSALRLGLMEKELKSMPLENQLLVIEVSFIIDVYA